MTSVVSFAQTSRAGLPAGFDRRVLPVGEQVIEFFHAHCFEHGFYVFLGCGNVMTGKFSRELIRVISEWRWLVA
jgi:hypothetical protein